MNWLVTVTLGEATALLQLTTGGASLDKRHLHDMLKMKSQMTGTVLFRAQMLVMHLAQPLFVSTMSRTEISTTMRIASGRSLQ